MIINDINKQCSFVDDITRYVLPSGWAKKPANELCPLSYTWVEKQNITGVNNTVINGTVNGTSNLTGGNITVNATDIRTTSSSDSICTAALVLFGFLALIFQLTPFSMNK
jgi:hypothetical protein